MKLVLSKKTIIELPPEKARALQDEMRYACNMVKVLAVMEA